MTVPGESRISAAHNLKLEKYQHFSTDISRYKVTVTPFEIGSNTGYISRANKESISKIHKYCKREIKLKNFKNNISAIAVLGSYYIFNNRNIESWHTPSNYIYAPMTNMWTKYVFIQRRNQDMHIHVNLSLKIPAFFIVLLYFFVETKQ